MYYLVSKYVSSAPTVVEGESHVPVWLCPRPFGSWKRRYSTVRWVLNRLEVELLNKFAQKKLPFTVKTWLGDFLSVGWPSLPYEMATSRLYWTFSTDIKKLFSIWRPPPLKLLRPPAKLPENDKAGYHFNLFHNRHLLGLSKVGLGAISQGLSL